MRRVLAALSVLVSATAFMGCNGGGPGDIGPNTRVALSTPTGVVSGDISLAYWLTRSDGTPVSINVLWSANGGSTWSPATRGTGGDGTSGLATSASGTAHTFVWASLADVGSVNATVRVRIGVSGGGAAVTADFAVSNGASGGSTGGSSSGGSTGSSSGGTSSGGTSSGGTTGGSSGGSTGGTLAADAYEPNDSRQAPANVSLPWSAQGLTIHSSTDVDFYAFTLAQATTVTATVQFTHANGDLDMYLMDSAGLPVAISNGTTDTEQVIVPVQGGTYYLRVYGYQGATNTYQASVVLAAPTGGGGGGGTTPTAPTLARLSPAYAARTGTVIVEGQGFDPAPAANVVRFGTIASTVYSVQSGQLITSVPTTAATGATQVTVEVAGQVSNALSFTVMDDPLITSISPSAAPTGTTVTVYGANFNTATNGVVVRFAGTSGVITTATSDTRIAVPVPGGALTGNVTVVSNGAVSNGYPFTVGTPAPVQTPPQITTVGTPASPASGAIAIPFTVADDQSDPVSIAVEYTTDAGASWLGATTHATSDPTTGLSSGPAPGVSHRFVWDSAANTGAVNVPSVVLRITPRDAGGTGPAVLVGPFAVSNAPVAPPPTPTGLTITSVSPATGSNFGGTRIVIRGTGFGSGATATVGNNALTNLVVVSSTEIQGDTIRVAWTGPADVQVSYAGSIAVAPNAFTYVVPSSAPMGVTSISPSSGPRAGGTVVTITGWGFAGTARVTIGGNPLTNIQVISATQIRATTPAVAWMGAATVIVDTDAGDAQLYWGFTYN